MVGGSQGVRKVLIYSGFNILLFFFCICQRVFTVLPPTSKLVLGLFEQPVL
jgi:hypothetical protein